MGVQHFCTMSCNDCGVLGCGLVIVLFGGELLCESCVQRRPVGLSDTFTSSDEESCHRGGEESFAEASSSGRDELCFDQYESE